MSAAKTTPSGSGLDEALLLRVRDRDPAAMGHFFEHFYDRVYGYLASLLRDRSAAEDLAQETFLKLHGALDRLDPSRDPAPWVFTVASNLARDHWRSGKQRTARQADAEEIETLPSESAGDDPLATLEQQEQARQVRRALAALPEDARQVILLRSFQEMGFPQIAETLGLSEDAVRQRHSRAVKRLGEDMTKQNRGTDTRERP